MKCGINFTVFFNLVSLEEVYTKVPTTYWFRRDHAMPGCRNLLYLSRSLQSRDNIAHI